MMPFDNSSPAFPCPVSLDARREIIQYPQSGMSARLYVAIELAKGLMQTPAWPLRTPTEQVRDARSPHVRTMWRSSQFLRDALKNRAARFRAARFGVIPLPRIKPIRL